RPRVALSPTRPQNEAGMRVDPPPSEDMLMGRMPTVTAAAEPPEEPPGVRSSFQGLRVTLTRPEIVGRSVESHAELRCRGPPDWDESGAEIVVDQRIRRLDGMVLEQLRARFLSASRETRAEVLQKDWHAIEKTLFARRIRIGVGKHIFV